MQSNEMSRLIKYPAKPKLEFYLIIGRTSPALKHSLLRGYKTCFDYFCKNDAVAQLIFQFVFSSVLLCMRLFICPTDNNSNYYPLLALCLVSCCSCNRGNNNIKIKKTVIAKWAPPKFEIGVYALFWCAGCQPARQLERIECD